MTKASTRRKSRERTTPVGRVLRAADKAHAIVIALEVKAAQWGGPAEDLRKACSRAKEEISRMKHEASDLSARGFVPPGRREGLQIARGDLVAIAPQHRVAYPGREDLEALVVVEVLSPEEVRVGTDDGEGFVKRPLLRHAMVVPRHHLAKRRPKDREAA